MIYSLLLATMFLPFYALMGRISFLETCSYTHDFAATCLDQQAEACLGPQYIQYISRALLRAPDTHIFDYQPKMPWNDFCNTLGVKYKDKRIASISHLLATKQVIQKYGLSNILSSMAMCGKMLAQEIKETAQGNIVFYHCQKWQLHFYTDFFKQLWNHIYPDNRAGDTFTFVKCIIP